jgi:release factor glutamine methyltransferase
MSTIKQILLKTNLAKLDAELIIAHVLQKPREYVIAHPELKISLLKTWKIKRLFKIRQDNFPLSYITGQKNFFGLDFIVNKNVLIPRPETEIMVETVLEQLKNNNNKNTILIDIGTGSGCIPISINKSIITSSTISTPTTFYAVDISKKALDIAKQNAKKHNVNINFLQGDLLKPIINKLKQNKQIIITANLPYITEKQFQTEPSIQHEPKEALVADNQGLALYEKLLKQIQQILLTFNFQLLTYLEIDPDQTEKIKKLIKKYLPEANIEIKKDLCGLDRLVIIKI